MAEPQQQEWHEEGRHQPVPMFTASELEAGGANNSEERAAHFGNQNAPRLLYGNTSRFGMVKGSIAARRANAAAAAAAKVRSPETETTEHIPTSTSSKTSLLAARAATTAAATADAPEIQTSQTAQLDGNCGDDFGKEEENRSNATPAHSNREEERREEDEEASRLLGPMGSFYELSKVSSAADLIRTASHDKSSHSVSQARGLRQANVPTAYSAIASTGYYRPSDRIGRLYTSTAAALTSTSAQSVAKAAATLAVAAGGPAGSGSGGGAGGSGGGGGGSAFNKARKNGGLGKLVTAPFAAESREILHTLALQPASSRGALAAALSLGTASSAAVAARPAGGTGEGGDTGNQSPLPTGASTSPEAFGSRSPGSPGRPKKAVVIDSEQHTRTQRREMRSPPRGRWILEVAPSSGDVGPSSISGGAAPSSGETAAAPDGGGGYAVKDFRSWNPAILGGIEGGGGGGGGGKSQHAVLDGSSSRSAAGGGINGDVGAGGDTVKAMSEAERQKVSIDLYWTTVEDRMLNGSPNALGAGAKSPLLELPPERVDGITSRLAFELRFIPGIELGAYQAYVEAAVNSMLQDVQVGHSVSVARAVVDYELKDPEGRRSLGIERGHLTAGPRWYQSQEYLIPEWRVLRHTGVSRARVRRSALALKRRLCSVETVMVGLEKLWHSGVVPGDWDTAAFGGSGDVVGGNVKSDTATNLANNRTHTAIHTFKFCSVSRRMHKAERKYSSGVHLQKKQGVFCCGCEHCTPKC